MWREIFGGDGVFNFILAFFGLPGLDWLGNPTNRHLDLDSAGCLAVWLADVNFPGRPQTNPG